MNIEEIDDLDYYHLPVIAPYDHYEPGQCIRNKDPYPNEPEKMILEIHADKAYYLIQAIYEGGVAGWRERLSIREAHFYYEKV